ncbi:MULTISPECIES: hypothetical protein [Burkholderia]|uniref:hypothetical protein n=1 Tax=Burkholderia vietnamiensis TaxID=60552 RepID=UPI00075C29EF|nr:hypothetical protein [Burkholderia vietnamiensis]KVF97019.1 hypothetical protein WJ21_16765 [Burkholderia vietnamiensis]UKV72848.1 hypothetical protein FOC29_03320 [Burkholderia vietnamiensis]CAG9197039.1 e14 prophage; protein YmfR [Burkholderia vietnamiensis]HDR8962497.1 hypothetical protein [Burkholderia vietnamiensis]HDR9203777.1 hypothetical protein [Burkholderia vietnamiensis]
MNSIGIAAWVAGLLGFALLVTGVMLISLPIGLIVAGVLLLLWALLADMAAARAQQVRQPKE